jgi:hypothetical protein
MTYKEVLKLQPGDEVYWNDPDDGVCSRYYRIQSIDVAPNMGACGRHTVVHIQDVDGSSLECFPHELS